MPSGDCGSVPIATSVTKICPLGTQSADCGAGYSQSSDVDGCHRCTVINCPRGETLKGCANGYTPVDTANYSGKKRCHECKPAACPSGSAVNKTCGSGWTANNVMIEGTSTFAKSGDEICQKCVAKTCEVGGTDVSCNSSCQEKVSTGYKSGDSTCYECKTKAGYTYANNECTLNTCKVGDSEKTCDTSIYGYKFASNGKTFVNTSGETVRCGTCSCDPEYYTTDSNGDCQCKDAVILPEISVFGSGTDRNAKKLITDSKGLGPYKCAYDIYVRGHVDDTFLVTDYYTGEELYKLDRGEFWADGILYTIPAGQRVLVYALDIAGGSLTWDGVCYRNAQKPTGKGVMELRLNTKYTATTGKGYDPYKAGCTRSYWLCDLWGDCIDYGY